MVKIGRDDLGPGIYEVGCDECGRTIFTVNPDGPRICKACVIMDDFFDDAEKEAS